MKVSGLAAVQLLDRPIGVDLGFVGAVDGLFELIGETATLLARFLRCGRGRQGRINGINICHR